MTGMTKLMTIASDRPMFERVDGMESASERGIMKR